MKINISQFGLKDSSVENFWSNIMDRINCIWILRIQQSFHSSIQYHPIWVILHIIISPRRNLEPTESSISLSDAMVTLGEGFLMLPCQFFNFEMRMLDFSNSIPQNLNIEKMSEETILSELTRSGEGMLPFSGLFCSHVVIQSLLHIHQNAYPSQQLFSPSQLLLLPRNGVGANSDISRH